MVPTAPEFAKSLFFGLINEDLLFPFPRGAAASTAALRLFLDSVRRFGQSHVDSRRIDADARIPREVMQGLRGLGLFGVVAPEEYGGSGLSTASFCRVIQELATIDASVALTVGAHQTVGMRGLLLFGTEEQKKKLEQLMEEEEGATRKVAGFWDKVITVLAVGMSLILTKPLNELNRTIEETDRALSAFIPKSASFAPGNLARQPLLTALIYPFYRQGSCYARVPGREGA